MSKLYLTAAAALVTLAFAAPIAPESLPGSLGPRDNPYTMYTGDGSSGDGWPTSDSWPDYETMFSNNAPLMGISCTEFGQDNNSPDETQAIHDSVLSVAGSSGVDPRFILAIVIQESKGCVRVPSTSGVNPGLMQDANGSGTCNVGGVGVQPCPNDQVSQIQPSFLRNLIYLLVDLSDGHRWGNRYRLWQRSTAVARTSLKWLPEWPADLHGCSHVQFRLCRC